MRKVKGHVFPACSFVLNEADIGAYMEAAGDTAFAAGAPERVPPLAAAAFALRALLATYDLPAGVVHTGEEIEMTRLARSGEPLRCESMVTQSADRQGHRFATIEQRLIDASGQPVVVTRAALIAPLPAMSAAS